MNETRGQRARKAAGDTKRARSRASALRACAELLLEADGDRSKLTLAAIAERSGLSVVTILKHFGSKDDLLNAAEVSSQSMDARLLNDDELLAQALKVHRISSLDEIELVAAATERWEGRAPSVVLDLLAQLVDSPLVDGAKRLSFGRRAEWIAMQSRDVSRLAEVRVSLGGVLGEQGQHDEAREVLEKVYGNVDAEIEVRANAAASIAALEALSGSLPEADRWLNLVLDLDQESENPWTFRLRVAWAVSLLELFGHNTSIPSILKRVDPDTIDGMLPWQRAVVARASGNISEARRAHIEDSTPHSSDEVLNLAKCERFVGNLDSAEQLLDVAESRLVLEQSTAVGHIVRRDLIERQIMEEKRLVTSSGPPKTIEVRKIDRLSRALRDVEEDLRSGSSLAGSDTDALNSLLLQVQGYVAPVPGSWYLIEDD